MSYFLQLFTFVRDSYNYQSKLSWNPRADFDSQILHEVRKIKSCASFRMFTNVHLIF